MPKAVPRKETGARLATIAFSVPSASAKWTPYISSHRVNAANDSLTAKPAYTDVYTIQDATSTGFRPMWLPQRPTGCGEGRLDDVHRAQTSGMDAGPPAASVKRRSRNASSNCQG